MTRLNHISARIRHWLRDEAGTALVEFSIVLTLFFLVFFAVIDFGRLMYSYVHAEKAAQLAVRIATVREAVCAGVPDTHERSDAAGNIQSGTTCEYNTGSGGAGATCKAASFSCGSITRTGTNMTYTALDTTHPTVQEIWNRIENLMPPGTDETVLNFRYDFDPALGFIGGPYTPIVTVEFDLPDFQFVSPVGGLMALARGQTGGAQAGDIAYPRFSVSLPAEDLNNGP